MSRLTQSPPSQSSLVLIADDDAACLQILYETLSGAGFELVVANDGGMALDLARKQVPDLVLLDVLMPDTNGLEVCRRLKEDPSTSEIPVVFMTSRDETRCRIEAFEVGGVDYIGKPFEEAELLARVKTHVSIRQLTKALRAEIRERAAAEAARERVMAELVERTEQLREAYERLEIELAERQRAEETRAVLQTQIIEGQRQRLAELSAPLIPITDRILVMPLIGSLDADRAKQLMEIALQGISSRGAEFVILDVTGVRALDAGVAAMLVQTSEALRLLGARAIVTGIGPDVARMLVEIDASLSSLVTHGTLQRGFEYAMQASPARTRRSARRDA